MPRPALVTLEDAVALVEQFIDHLRTQELPPYSSNVWKEMSKIVNEKWSPHLVFTNVKQDRRSILSIARRNHGIFVKESSGAPADETLDATLDDTMANQSIDDPYEFETKAQGLDEFRLVISRDEWNEMIGSPIVYGDGKVYSILHKEKWAGLLSIIIYRQTELPCAFVFDNSKIYNSSDSLHYCRITGHCKSKQCGNRIFCYVEKPPGDSDTFVMTMRAKETFWEKHEKVKRDLRGYWRQEIGEKVYYMGAGNYQKEEALKDTRFGGRVGPHIPWMNVLRAAKSDTVKRKYDIKTGDGKDVVKTIEIMRYSEPYRSFIHDVKRDRFYVSFSTYAQMLGYKNYCRLMKKDAVVGIDGTGSIVKKFRRLDGTKTSHIFLYSITINHGGRTIAVHEALTESQETDIFSWWLAHWQRMGAPIPPQVSCDRSRALMNGISLSLNNMTVQVYVEILFLRALKGNDNTYYPPVYCYLRNDVAHLMILVAKWNVFKKIPFSTVRQMYLYCLGLLIDAQNLQQFREFFLLILTIGLHKSDDTIIKAIKGYTVADCRKKLQGYIATRNFPFEGDDLEKCAAASSIKPEDNVEVTRSESSPIQNWINDLRETAEFPKNEREIERGQLNVYYAEEFINRLIELAYEFPLWSAAAIPRKVGHSSTAFTEGFFNDLKHRVNKNHRGSLRADLFLKRMYTNNAGGAALFTSETKDSEGKSSDTLGQDQGSFSTPQNAKNHVQSSSDPSEDDSDDSNSSDSTNKSNHTRENRQQSNEQMEDNNGFEEYEHDRSSPVSENLLLSESFDDNPSKFASSKPIVHKSSDKKRRHDSRETKNPQHFEDKMKGPVLKKSRRSSSVEICSSANDIFRCNKKKTPKKSKGKYFQPRPDIQHRDELVTDIQKSSLLINSNHKKGKISINNQIYYAENTCGFDAMIQILAGVLMDNKQLKELASKSTNRTLKFVLEFIKNGSQAKIYQEKTKLLQSLFPQRIQWHYKDSKTLASGGIDMFDDLVKIWTGSFSKDPSLVFINKCSRCGTYESQQAHLNVNHDMISHNPKVGLNDLQDALQFNFMLQIVTCTKTNEEKKKPCNGDVIMIPSALGDFIFIELDIPNLEVSTVSNCELRTIPRTLKLINDEFRLAGIISSRPGHHTSYCWRGKDIWEFCDSSASKVVRVKEKTHVKPSAVIYVKIFRGDECDHSEENEQTPEDPSKISSNVAGTPPRMRSPIISPTLSPTINLCSSNVDDNLNRSSLLIEENRNTEDFRRRERDPDTISQDNWRNKADPDLYWTEQAEESTFIADCNGDTSHAETLYSNDTFDQFPNSILYAGNVMPAVEINENIIHLTNTTILDSLIHILLYTARDFPDYWRSIRNSNTKLLRFIASLKNRNFDASVYTERAAMMVDLFPTKIRKETEGGDIVCTLDLDESVSKVWELCLMNSPSVFRIYDCKECGQYAVTVPTINVDSHAIYRQDFTILQQALQFYPTLTKVQCYKKNCKRLCSITCHASYHFFVNLEIKVKGRAQKTLESKLGDIPTSLILEKKNRYRIAGVIAQSGNGFVAYCNRQSKSSTWWEKYDSSLGTVQSAHPCDRIKPHGVIYVLDTVSIPEHQ